MKSGLRLLLLWVFSLTQVAECSDLTAVAAGDGEYPDYTCPLDPLHIEIECNIREAIKYLDPANDANEGYTNVRLKVHDSQSPDFVYQWDQTRALVVTYELRINTGYSSDRYALIEGYDGPEHTEDENAYHDAGFILVAEGGEVYIECVRFQHFNRLVLPALAIHSYPELESTISHGGVLSARDGGYLYVVACQFYNNSAKQGGAVYVAGAENATTTVEIASGTLFLSNHAEYSGGAMYVEASLPAVVDIGTDRASTFVCSDYYDLYEPTTNGLTLIEKDSDCGVRFAGNSAGYYGGGLAVASEVPPTLDYVNEVEIHEYCEFSANTAGIDGGGMYMYYTPGVDIKGSVSFISNEANYGGGIYGSRMLTFVLGESCVFDGNFADECGGGMYLNIAGCANPCQPGTDDSTIRFSGNTAGNSQGGCPESMLVDDNSFGANNCTYVHGYECVPTNDEVDTSYFPIEQQTANSFEVQFQVNYNRFTIAEVLEYFEWTCNSTVPYGDPSSCLTDCGSYPDDLACVDDEDQCDSQPCENGATCYDRKNSFSCECMDGFSGIYCETNIPDCLSAPCQNGATCVDGIQSFSCSCTALYEGELCDELIADSLSGAHRSHLHSVVVGLCLLLIATVFGI